VLYDILAMGHRVSRLVVILSPAGRLPADPLVGRAVLCTPSPDSRRRAQSDSPYLASRLKVITAASGEDEELDVASVLLSASESL
jgi:hypothetical protein